MRLYHYQLRIPGVIPNEYQTVISSSIKQLKSINCRMFGCVVCCCKLLNKMMILGFVMTFADLFHSLVFFLRAELEKDGENRFHNSLLVSPFQQLFRQFFLSNGVINLIEFDDVVFSRRGRLFDVNKAMALNILLDAARQQKQKEATDVEEDDLVGVAVVVLSPDNIVGDDDVDKKQMKMEDRDSKGNVFVSSFTPDDLEYGLTQYGLDYTIPDGWGSVLSDRNLKNVVIPFLTKFLAQKIAPKYPHISVVVNGRIEDALKAARMSVNGAGSSALSVTFEEDVGFQYNLLPDYGSTHREGDQLVVSFVGLNIQQCKWSGVQHLISTVDSDILYSDFDQGTNSESESDDIDALDRRPFRCDCT